MPAVTLPPLSLYVHLPWCVRKCPYCDFNSHRRPQVLPETAYVTALLADLDHDLPLARDRPLVSVFFGGGTPSLFSASAIAAILAGVRQRLSLPADAEVTLECNPGTAEHDRFEGYREAGVNRLSLGVQSFDDAMLRRLGRIHGGSEAHRALVLARRAGFANLNVDLMQQLPGQQLAGALDDLEQALAHAPEHLSYYQLTLEPGTVFASRPPELPDEDTAEAIESAGLARLAAAGFERYEVSAYARPGHRAVHNLNVWRFGDYLGIGAGAHGKTTLPDGTVLRRSKRRAPGSYLSAPAAGHVEEERRVDPAELPFEFLLNAARLREGFSLQSFLAATGCELTSLPGWHKAVRDGLFETEGTRVRTSERGLRYLNDLLLAFT